MDKKEESTIRRYVFTMKELQKLLPVQGEIFRLSINPGVLGVELNVKTEELSEEMKNNREEVKKQIHNEVIKIFERERVSESCQKTAESLTEQDVATSTTTNGNSTTKEESSSNSSPTDST